MRFLPHGPHGLSIVRTHRFVQRKRSDGPHSAQAFRFSCLNLCPFERSQSQFLSTSTTRDDPGPRVSGRSELWFGQKNTGPFGGQPAAISQNIHEEECQTKSVVRTQTEAMKKGPTFKMNLQKLDLIISYLQNLKGVHFGLHQKPGYYVLCVHTLTWITTSML